MEEIVFIGWNGSPDLAIAVKGRLAAHGFCGVVGGNFEENPEAFRQMRDTVNATVKSQMDGCSQAIVILTRYDQLGSEANIRISGNLCYEIGYLTARFKSTDDAAKIHLFNIGVSVSDLPSDIQGLWDGGTNTMPDDSLDIKADKIVEEFLRRQKLATKRDYFSFCNEYHLIEYKMARHFNTPLVSNRDLAFQTIFYLQSSYIYSDVSNALVQLQNLEDAMREAYATISPDFEAIFKFGRLSLGLFRLAIPEDTDDLRVVLDSSTFRKTKREYVRLIESLAKGAGVDATSPVHLDDEALDDHEFESLLLMQVQQHLTFLYLLYLDSPQHSQAERSKLAGDAIEACKVVIGNLELLKKRRYGMLYAVLLLGFTYHNMSIFYDLTGDDEGMRECEALALETRRVIYEAIVNRSGINQGLKSYAELEYYFQLADCIDTVADEDDRLDYCDEIEEFISRRTMRKNMEYLTFDRLVQMFEAIDRQ